MGSISYTEAPPIPSIYRHGNSDILPAWSQREAAAAEQPWTATRCHRQLRPLLAHLAALRREKAIAESKKKKEDSMRPTNDKKRLSCDTDASDRKRVRYTYSLKGTRRQRHRQSDAAPSDVIETPDRPTNDRKPKYVPAKQQSQRSFSPGEIVLATPMLSRARKNRYTQSLPSSPLKAHMEEPSSANTTQPSGGTNPVKPKADNPMSSHYGYYRRLPRAGSNAAAKTPVDEEWALLTKETPAEYHALHGAVFRTFDSILRATTDTRETTGKVNSLLAMCLRKVPQLISMCEEADRTSSEEKEAGASSVSLDVYNDLESFGMAGNGWKHLRVVVREHAVNILREACGEGLFHFAFVRLLVRLCTNMKAYAEAEAFMAALFDLHILAVPKGQRLMRPPIDADSGLPESTGASSSLGLLIAYAGETGRTSFPLRQLTSLLEHGHLPPAWLSTQAFSSIWHRVARLLSSRGTTACDEAALADFVVAAMTRLVRSYPADDISSCQSVQATPPASCDGAASPLSSSSSYHTLVSILGTMCAICILQREALVSGSNGGESVPEPLVAQRLSKIIHCCLAEVGGKQRQRRRRLSGTDEAALVPRRYLLNAALCVLRLGHESSPAEACGNQQAVARADGAAKGQLYDVTVAFATSVAENCGRASKSVGVTPDCRDYLRSICMALAGKLGAVADWDSDKDLSRRLLADSAFLLASRSNDLRDLAFAESLGKTLKRAASRTGVPEAWCCRSPKPVSFKPLATPLSSARTGAAGTGLFEGYRWEEGISEWVISTPTSGSSKPGRVDNRNKRQTRSRSAGLAVLPDGDAGEDDEGDEDDEVDGVDEDGEDDEAGTLAAMKPDLLRTPVSYLTPMSSMRASSNMGDAVDDDASDNGEASDDSASPQLPARVQRRSTGRPRRTCRGLPSSDLGADSDWTPETQQRRSWRPRPKRASVPAHARHEGRLLRPRKSISMLDLVSDDGGDDVFSSHSHEDTSPSSSKSTATSTATARQPLLRICGNVKRLGQLGKTKHRETKRRRSGGASGTSASGHVVQAAVAASSDDELGL